MISSEKQFFKKFAGEDGRSARTLEALSPPSSGYGCYAFSSSPGGGGYSRSFSRSSGSEDESSVTLCDAIERKTLFHLISTLNAAFPDYDFSTAKSEEFTKEPNLQVIRSVSWLLIETHLIFCQFVTNNIDNLLSISATSQYGKIHDKLWHTLNTEIELLDCDIYSYNPDLTLDPFGEDGSIWSFNYFFFNKKLKRVVLFTCRALSPFSQGFYDPCMTQPEDQMELYWDSDPSLTLYHQTF